VKRLAPTCVCGAGCPVQATAGLYAMLDGTAAVTSAALREPTAHRCDSGGAPGKRHNKHNGSGVANLAPSEILV